MTRPLISAVIKAKDEAHQITECLASLQGFADEIIVVDDGSADETAAIARQLGARVIEAESHDGLISLLDRIGFEAAAGEWILRMDADERMIPTLARKLRQIAEAGQYAGVSFARKNIMFGDWARYGGWFKSDQLRFFRADSWDRNWPFSLLGGPHVQPGVEGPLLILPARVELATVHYDYDSVPQFIHRSLLGYAKTEAIAMHGGGVRFSPFRLVFKPLKRFLGRYFIRQGWRDGWRGLVLAGLLAAYDFCIEADLWDLERRKRD